MLRAAENTVTSGRWGCAWVWFQLMVTRKSDVCHSVPSSFSLLWNISNVQSSTPKLSLLSTFRTTRGRFLFLFVACVRASLVAFLLCQNTFKWLRLLPVYVKTDRSKVTGSGLQNSWVMRTLEERSTTPLQRSVSSLSELTLHRKDF